MPGFLPSRFTVSSWSDRRRLGRGVVQYLANVHMKCVFVCTFSHDMGLLQLQYLCVIAPGPSSQSSRRRPLWQVQTFILLLCHGIQSTLCAAIKEVPALVFWCILGNNREQTPLFSYLLVNVAATAPDDEHVQHSGGSFQFSLIIPTNLIPPPPTHMCS